VVGQQPLLKPGQAFEYTSGTRLRTPTGTMHGSFFCVAEDGEKFDADVPMFVLDASALRGFVATASVAAVLARISLLLDAIAKPDPNSGPACSCLVAGADQALDVATLLADYGFSTRNAFISEFAERLRQKMLPGTPETLDAAELFSLVMGGQRV
jgi:hypothetical protein